MLKFIGKRVLMLIPVLIGVSLIVFTLMQLSPGEVWGGSPKRQPQERRGADPVKELRP